MYTLKITGEDYRTWVLPAEEFNYGLGKIKRKETGAFYLEASFSTKDGTNFGIERFLLNCDNLKVDQAVFYIIRINAEITEVIVVKEDHYPVYVMENGKTIDKI